MRSMCRLAIAILFVASAAGVMFAQDNPQQPPPIPVRENQLPPQDQVPPQNQVDPNRSVPPADLSPLPQVPDAATAAQVPTPVAPSGTQTAVAPSATPTVSMLPPGVTPAQQTQAQERTKAQQSTRATAKKTVRKTAEDKAAVSASRDDTSKSKAAAAAAAVAANDSTGPSGSAPPPPSSGSAAGIDSTLIPNSAAPAPAASRDVPVNNATTTARTATTTQTPAQTQSIASWILGGILVLGLIGVVILTARRRQEERLTIFDRTLLPRATSVTRIQKVTPATGEFAHVPRS